MRNMNQATPKTLSALSGWGRFPILPCRVSHPRQEKALAEQIHQRSCIARGNGRSYGDSAMNPQHTVDMLHFRHMLAFDPRRGILETEAGVTLDDVIATFLPRGWFVPVTPGTRFVTIGGMIAADVHGKNHHQHGSFGNFIQWIDVMDHQGIIRRCSRRSHRQYFEWTIGGMGLSGIILRAAFTLIPVESAWIKQTTVALENLEDTMAAFDDHDDSTYSVAWIDSLAQGKKLGRSILILGEHAQRQSLDHPYQSDPLHIPKKNPWQMPFHTPSWALSRWSARGAARAFNAIYYRYHARHSGTTVVDLYHYFYPLDRLLGWNRLYGHTGLVQFQCVLPLATAKAGLKRLLDTVASSQQGSFLAVLKRLGPQKSRISFPMEGYTLAMDFPATPACLSLLEKLDRITIDHGGRFYLAKDARLRAKTLHQSDPRMLEFASLRKKNSAMRGFASVQSERLKI